MKLLITLIILIVLGVYSYFSMSLFREAAKRKNQMLEIFAAIGLAVMVILNTIIILRLTDFVGLVEKNERNADISMLFFLPMMLGMFLRVLKYRLFEKGKKIDLCPECGAQEKKKNTQYCWYCGAKMLDPNNITKEKSVAKKER